MNICIPMGGTGGKITEHIAAALKEKEVKPIPVILDNPEEKKASDEAENDENKDEENTQSIKNI